MAMIRVRPFTEDDQEQVVLMDSVSFALTYPPDQVEFALRLVRDRMLVAEWTDDDAAANGAGLPVGVTSAYDLTVSMPGGRRITAPGITWVSVRPTHRRQGVLTAMIGRQLDDAREAGAEAAVLTASESSIYGRYGFGVATRTHTVEIDRRTARLREPVDKTGVLVATPEQARSVLPELYEAQRARVPGMINRSPGWWEQYFEDPEWVRGGLGERRYLIHPEGYLAFRGQDRYVDDELSNRALVRDYQPGSRTAHAALWAVLLDLDLFSAIEVGWLHVDDPLPDLLVAPRNLRVVRDVDGMWLRPLHPDALLAARTYALDLDVVVGVRDARYGDSCYRLVAGSDGAQCTPTDAEPDVALDVAVLGSVSLGGVRLQHCAGVDGDPAAIRRLDRALLGDRAPNHTTTF